MQRPRPLLLVLSFALVQGLLLVGLGGMNVINSSSIAEDRNEELWSEYRESVASLADEQSSATEGPVPSGESSSSSSIEEPTEVTAGLVRGWGVASLVLGLVELALAAVLYTRADRRARLPLLIVMVVVGGIGLLGLPGLAIALFAVYALAMNIPTRRFLDPSFVPPVNRRIAAAQAKAARSEAGTGGTIDTDAVDADDERP